MARTNLLKHLPSSWRHAEFISATHLKELYPHLKVALAGIIVILTLEDFKEGTAQVPMAIGLERFTPIKFRIQAQNADNRIIE